MKQLIGMAISSTALLIAGCSDPPKTVEPQNEVSSLEVAGHWLKTNDDKVMPDPQTSGLTHWQGKLVSISDGSADTSQQRRLHIIDPGTKTVKTDTEAMRLATIVRRSCFSDYLANAPDLEALVADPIDTAVFYTVTEDATRTGALSQRCQNKYQNTGSTDYPTLLVRLQISDYGVTMTGVRPLQFPLSLNVGDFPNDGIEGLAITDDNKLYLGLEKDSDSQPRIFSVDLEDGFWNTTEFAPVMDPGLQVPEFTEGSHPINGLDYYKDESSGNGYLLAAARNDNELWIIGTEPKTAAKRILMHFTADVPNTPDNCEATEIMDNASIEGLAVIEDTLWLINDPWKVNYMKNVKCEANRERYDAMAPLLFSTPVDPAWFE